MKKDGEALAFGVTALILGLFCLGSMLFDFAVIVAGALGNAFAAIAGSDEPVLREQILMAGWGIYLKPFMGLASAAGGIAAIVFSRGKGRRRAVFVAEVVTAAVCSALSLAYIAAAAITGKPFWWNYLSVAAAVACSVLLILSAVRVRRGRTESDAGQASGGQL